MRRAVLLAVLSLLLLSMQHRGYVHPFSHLATPSQETVLSTQQATADCVECALLAGGFNAVSTSLVPVALDSPAASLVFHSYHSRAAEVPAWFQSRAPPTLL